MSQSISDYLQLHPVDAAPYSDTREPLASRIFRLLTRSQFRSAPLSDTTRDFVRQHIDEKVKVSQPIVLAYAMGGGRGINTHNFPHADWGEYLHLKFLVENLQPIGEIYSPGIEIRWSLDDYAARIINNYKAEWQELYIQGFDAMHHYFNNLPGVGVKHTRIPTDTWYKDFEALKAKLLSDAKARANTPEAKEIIAQWGKRAANNFYNVDHLEGGELQKAIEFSTIVNMAWLDYDFGVREEFFTSGIPIAHFTAFPDSFYIQTVPGSNTQFWKGNGYLERVGEMYKSRIATREKWEDLKPNLKFVANPLSNQLPDLGELPIYTKA